MLLSKPEDVHRRWTGHYKEMLTIDKYEEGLMVEEKEQSRMSKR